MTFIRIPSHRQAFFMTSTRIYLFIQVVTSFLWALCCLQQQQCRILVMVMVIVMVVVMVMIRVIVTIVVMVIV